VESQLLANQLFCERYTTNGVETLSYITRTLFQLLSQMVGFNPVVKRGRQEAAGGQPRGKPRVCVGGVGQLHTAVMHTTYMRHLRQALNYVSRKDCSSHDVTPFQQIES
jgi:hypothetical protein